MAGKVTPHLTQDEPLLFETSSPGKVGYQLPPLDVPAVDPAVALGADAVRDAIEGFPEVSEVEVIRHFTRLSTWNYAIDLGLYPLGSCTMKYNPRVNEAVARIDGLAWGHPYQPESLSQGGMEIMHVLEQFLAEITGMDAVTLQPAAGAQGEFTGILLIRACLEARGDARKTILVPDSAHGTNPATARMCGYDVVNVKSNARGMVDMDHFRTLVNPSVAGIMITNPNTVGLFEENIVEITRLLHQNGSLVYMDGANMNALVGVARPGDFGVDVMHLNLHKTFSTPHGGGGPGAGAVAVKAILEPFLPSPRIYKENEVYRYQHHLPSSIGKVRAYCGNFGVFVRALAYILAHGNNLRKATLDAVLNANYIRQ
ncbi:MAG: aminomethyl-transferring glycine dehydrogenase subunit GcvPB, partial [Bryobacterales bacterium]|nr:aminomethyl-transferring glycine dehydrogenase subunit GcvPB [Bryobacterales bacterium]